MKAFALAVAVLLAACTPPTQRSGRLSPDIFEDIPAPKSARYIYRQHESFSYRSKTFRCGKFLYEYQGDVDDAVRFFKDTMGNPPYSWTLADEVAPGSGSTTLVFTKNTDRCTVDIDRVPRPELKRQKNVEIKVRVNYRK